MDHSLICIELLFCQSFKKWGSYWDEKPEFYSIKYVRFFEIESFWGFLSNR